MLHHTTLGNWFNGVAGLEAFFAHQDHIELVLADIVMYGASKCDMELLVPAPFRRDNIIRI